MIETAPWGDDPAAIDQHIMNHSKFQSSINSSVEVDRARDELVRLFSLLSLQISKLVDRSLFLLRHPLKNDWPRIATFSAGPTVQDIKNGNFQKSCVRFFFFLLCSF